MLVLTQRRARNLAHDKAIRPWTSTFQSLCGIDVLLGPSVLVDTAPLYQPSSLCPCCFLLGIFLYTEGITEVSQSCFGMARIQAADLRTGNGSLDTGMSWRKGAELLGEAKQLEGEASLTEQSPRASAALLQGVVLAVVSTRLVIYCPPPASPTQEVCSPSVEGSQRGFLPSFLFSWGGEGCFIFSR